jgi:tetratricopeptide (TPR) repeat protein
MLPEILLAALLAPVPQETTPPPAEPAAEPAATRPAAAAADEDHIAAGLKAFKRRRFKEAERHFRAAVDADPGSAAAHFYLGYTIYKEVEPRRPFHPGKQEAAQHFAKAYELDPAFTPVWGPRT